MPAKESPCPSHRTEVAERWCYSHVGLNQDGLTTVHGYPAYADLGLNSASAVGTARPCAMHSTGIFSCSAGTYVGQAPSHEGEVCLHLSLRCCETVTTAR